MAVVIPSGSTIVQTFRKSFSDVPVDEANGRAVSTIEFLEAAESLTTIFGMCLVNFLSRKSLVGSNRHGSDALGSVAFSPVKSDMLGNIKVHLPK